MYSSNNIAQASQCFRRSDNGGYFRILQLKRVEIIHYLLQSGCQRHGKRREMRLRGRGEIKHVQATVYLLLG